MIKMMTEIDVPIFMMQHNHEFFTKANRQKGADK
jgi:hypothetical protein